MKIYTAKPKIIFNTLLGGFILNVGLVFLGALLFSLGFPSFLSRWGWFPFAYIALVPVFILVHRSGWISAAATGHRAGNHVSIPPSRRSSRRAGPDCIARSADGSRYAWHHCS